MSRTRVLQASLAPLLLAALVPGLARAQPGPDHTGRAGGPLGDPALTAKELAKACLEATRAKAPELARERVTAAREALHEQHEEFLAGRGYFGVLVDAARDWAEAGQAARDSPAARAAVLDRFWRLLWGWERPLKEGHEAGRVKTADYLESRARRLQAQAQLARAGRQKGREAMDPLFDLFPEAAWPADPLAARELAKAKDAARGITLPELARQRAATAREAVEARHQESFAFRMSRLGKPDPLWEAIASWAEAEQAARDSPAARAAALETLWRAAWAADHLMWQSYEAGRVTAADYLETTARRLEVEIRLARLLGGKGREAPAPELFPEDPVEAKEELTTKKLAKARDTARRAVLPDLARERAAASWAALHERHQEFLAGRGTLDFLLEGVLEPAVSWVEAEQAARHSPAARVAALDRLWRMAWPWERLAQSAHEAGRARTADYLRCKGFRLEVQGRLARARARRER
jgi:hypothetical protein